MDSTRVLTCTTAASVEVWWVADNSIFDEHSSTFVAISLAAWSIVTRMASMDSVWAVMVLAWAAIVVAWMSIAEICADVRETDGEDTVSGTMGPGLRSLILLRVAMAYCFA